MLQSQSQTANQIRRSYKNDQSDWPFYLVTVTWRNNRNSNKYDTYLGGSTVVGPTVVGSYKNDEFDWPFYLVTVTWRNNRNSIKYDTYLGGSTVVGPTVVGPKKLIVITKKQYLREQ